MKKILLTLLCLLITPALIIAVIIIMFIAIFHAVWLEDDKFDTDDITMTVGDLH